MPDVLDNPQQKTQTIDEFLGENPKIDDFLGPESKSADIPSSVKFETPEQIQAGQTASTAMRTGVFPSGMQFETQEQARARDAANPVTQALNKPIIPVTPKILESVVPSPVPGLWPALSAAIPAVKGLETSAAKQLAGFTSVAGLATLPLMEFKVGRTILTGLMAAQTPEAVKNTVDVLKAKNATPAQKWESLGDAGGNLLMLGAGALSLLPAKVKTTFTPEQVAQVVEKPPVIAKKPTTTEVSSATQKGQIEGDIQQQRQRADAQRLSTEAGAGNRVQSETPVVGAPQPKETGPTGAPPAPVRNALTTDWRKIAESPGAEFDALSKQHPQGVTGWAYDLAANITPADFEAINAEASRIGKENMKRMLSGEAQPAGLLKPQMLKEAVRMRQAMDEAKSTGAKTEAELAAIGRKYGVGAGGIGDDAAYAKTLRDMLANEPKPEQITAAAVKTPEGKVETGPHHPGILKRLGIKGFENRESRNTPNFGFVTDTGRFVTRPEAAELAKKSGQQLEQFDVDEKGVEQPHSDEIASPTQPKKPISETKPAKRSPTLTGWFPRSDGVPDILDAINELGGIASPSQSAFKGGEYDAYKEAFGSGMAMRLRSATGGHAPDRLMKQLEDYGFKFETADQFYDAVKQANESRKNLRGQAAAEEAQLRQEQEQHEDFRKSVVQGKGTTAPAKTAGDILAVGSTFTHGGETFTVKEYDPDSDTYLVEDGRRFGRQYLSADDPIHPDPGSLTGEQTTEFTPKETAETPKLRTGEKKTGELFQGEDQPFNLAGETATDAERIAAEKAKAEKESAEAKIKQDKEQQQMVGLGGAARDEIPTGGNPDIYGVAARVREERAKAGQVPPVPTGEGISASDSVSRGRELLAAGADPEKVMAAFEKTKRLSGDDMAVVRANGERLAYQARRVEEAFGTNSPEYASAFQELADWDARSKAMQTEWHRTGQAQQGETDVDTGSFTGLQRAYREQTGKDFTPEQAKAAKKTAEESNKAEAEADKAQTELFKDLDATPMPTKMTTASERARAIWKRVKVYVERGLDNFDDIRNKVATDFGMKVDEVTKLMTQSKKTKRLADDVWKKQQVARRLKDQAKQWLMDQTTPGYKKALAKIPRILFSLKVGFHGTVALGTHAPMVAFQPQFWKTYVSDFGKMYKMVGSKAYYERQVQDLLRRQNYITARRAGLVNDPFQYEDYNSPQTSAYFGNLTGMGNRGYSVLKILRQDMFDQQWGNLPKSSQIPEVAKALADGINHATGVVKGRAPKGANIALFAPRLEASRVAWLAVDPIKAADTFARWKTATDAEKRFAVNQVKEKATVAATMFGLLALNQGLLSAMGSKQKINFDDPMKGDFLKFKVAGMNLSYGNAMLTMARLPVRLYAIRESSGGKTRNLIYPDEDVYTVLGEYGRSQESPFASLATDLWFRSDWMRRQLPGSNRPMPARLRAKGIKPYTWPEFLTEQVLPIPAEEAVREVWGSGFGMNPKQKASARKALATIAVMGATGARLSEDTQTPK